MMMVDDQLQIQKQLLSDFKYWSPVRRRFGPDHPFFASGNIERELLAKQVALDLTEQEKEQLRNSEDVEYRELFCPIVGCGTRLTSLLEFEDHYNARHTASCSVCSRVYPTSQLLGIHVSEAHDSFFQAKVARGYAMYECLVEGCGVKLKSYKSRQQHLMDKHNFPSSFEFLKKARPSKKERLKKNQRQQQATIKITEDEEGSSAMQVEDETLDKHNFPPSFEFLKKARPSKKDRLKKNQCQQQATIKITEDKEGSSAMQVEDETLNGLVSAVSKLTTSDSSPSVVSFGHRHTRGLTFVPRTVQRETKR